MVKQGNLTNKIRPRVFKSFKELQSYMGPSNSRKSTKYNIFTFLPSTLLYQFSRVVNCFYLFNAILQSIPAISTNDPLFTIIPLAVIVALGIIKELIVEISRWRADRKINAKPCKRLTGQGSIEDTTWSRVEVGDILQIFDGETIPADCILLRTKKGNNGMCFVQTTELDGERNLKPLMSSRYIDYYFSRIFIEKQMKFKAEFIEPCKDLYYYEGRIILSKQNPKTGAEKKKVINVDIKMFLHRGAVLRNSGSVFALVTQTGVQSKLIMNLGRYTYKISRIEAMLNYFSAINLAAMLFMAGMLTIANYHFNENYSSQSSYIFQKSTQTNRQYSTAAFFSFYLILNGYIPLDLLLCIEIAKFLCTPFMELDAEMKCVDVIPTGGDTSEQVIKGFKANTLNLHEDLAEVEYIFADKTGTLTQNELVFREMAILNNEDLILIRNPDQNDRNQINLKGYTAAQDFFTCLAVCQDCITSQTKLGKTIYSGPSVDEVCLLEMSRDVDYMGYFKQRTSDSIVIGSSHSNLRQQDETSKRQNTNKSLNKSTASAKDSSGQQTYKIIKAFPFTSDRKAMSVIAKRPDGKIFLYVKGADSSLFKMSDGQGVEELSEEIERMAAKGYRTLVFGVKEIKTNFDWENLTSDFVEHSLKLVAVTGVEDLLQENVKECITDFRDAGMKVWMLTGDKGLTAKEIAYSCGLLVKTGDSWVNPAEIQLTEQNIKDGSQPFQFEETNYNNFRGCFSCLNRLNYTKILDKKYPVVSLTDATLTFEIPDTSNKTKIEEFLQNVQKEIQSTGQHSFSLIISGLTMQIVIDAFKNEKGSKLADYAVSLLLKAETVVMYRSSPSQKAQVVNLIRTNLRGKKTLAVGDGANDINMIQSAHIGFGIMGKEGNQASAFADYAVTRFKDLRRALFWHGSSFGLKLGQVILAGLFKSTLFSTCIFYLQMVNGFSGQQPIEGALYALFDVNMTQFAIGFFVVLTQVSSFSKYGSEDQEKQMPYKMSRLYLSIKEQQKWILPSYLVQLVYVHVVAAAVYGVFKACQNGNIGINGGAETVDLFTYGVLVCMVTVVLTHLQLASFTRSWNWLWTLMWLFSLANILADFYLAESDSSSELTGGIYSDVLGRPLIWLQLLLLSFVFGMPWYMIRVNRALFTEPSIYSRD